MEFNPGAGPTPFKPQEPYMDRDDAGGTPDTDPMANAELANRYFRAGESLTSEKVMGAETPQELFEGLRDLLKDNIEDAETPRGLSNPYSASRLLETMKDRAAMLEVPLEKLIEEGKIKDYNPVNGEGVPAKSKYDAYAISAEQYVKSNERGPVEHHTRYFFGSSEERKDLARAYRRGISELQARSIVDAQVGIKMSALRDDIAGLTTTFYERADRLKVPHLKAFFNMPSIESLTKAEPGPESGVENKVLGTQVEKALWLYYAMLSSGTKKGMKDFLARPATKALMTKGMSPAEAAIFLNETIGDVSSWVEDSERDSKTYLTETRGPITKFSNIAAYEARSGGEKLSTEKEMEFIKEVGKLVGSVEAAWLAGSFARMAGIFASKGYVAGLKDGKYVLTLGEGQFISSDDEGKFLVNLYHRKEADKDRPSGLKDLVSRIPDMAIDLTEFGQVDVEINGTLEKRSIVDAWLGTAQGFKIDLLTGAETEIPLAEEPYHRLGDLNFDSLARDFHGSYLNMKWLMGREERGVLDMVMKTDFRPEDFSVKSLKSLWKYISIVYNPTNLTKGSPHKYDLGEDGAYTKVVPLNLFKNIYSARKRSASYVTGILNQGVKMYDPGLASTDHEKTTSLAAMIEGNFNTMVQSIETSIRTGKPAGLEEKYLDTFEELLVVGPLAQNGKLVEDIKFEEATGIITGSQVKTEVKKTLRDEMRRIWAKK